MKTPGYTKVAGFFMSKMTAFNKHRRLLKAHDFVSVFKSKPVVSNDRFFRVLAKKTAAQTRLGLVVSKKVDKRAVERNRIKRMVREVFRHWYNADDTTVVSADIVFQAKPAASGACNQNLQAATYQHLINIQKQLKDIAHAGNA